MNSSECFDLCMCVCLWECYNHSITVTDPLLVYKSNAQKISHSSTECTAQRSSFVSSKYLFCIQISHGFVDCFCFVDKSPRHIADEKVPLKIIWKLKARIEIWYAEIINKRYFIRLFCLIRSGRKQNMQIQ